MSELWTPGLLQSVLCGPQAALVSRAEAGAGRAWVPASVVQGW